MAPQAAAPMSEALAAAPPLLEVTLPSQAIEYRVLQRSVIKRLGSDPATGGAVKLARQVGSTVFTTGRTWTGPQGGEWVELDNIVEKPGWLLVEGPGFGVLGPILRRVVPGEEPPLVLRSEQPTPVEDKDLVEYREFVVGRNATVMEAKRWIALNWELNPSKLIIARPPDPSTPYKEYYGRVPPICSPDGLLQDDEGLTEVGFSNGDQVQYVYTGQLAKLYGGQEPTWARKLGTKTQESPKVESTAESRFLELREQFQLLGLPESTPPDEIKRHYRQLALECHPDKHPENVEAATRRFQEIKAAYEAIRDRLRF